MKTLELAEFRDTCDGSFSHWSVVQVDDKGQIVELATCVMHDTPLQAWRELRQIEREEQTP